MCSASSKKGALREGEHVCQKDWAGGSHDTTQKKKDMKKIRVKVSTSGCTRKEKPWLRHLHESPPNIDPFLGCHASIWDHSENLQCPIEAVVHKSEGRHYLQQCNLSGYHYTSGRVPHQEGPAGLDSTETVGGLIPGIDSTSTSCAVHIV